MLLARPEELPPPGAGAEEIRGGAEEILRRPEFQEPPRSLYQQALDRIGEVLGDLIGALVSGTSGAVVAWVLLVVVVCLLAYLVSRGVQADRRRRAPAADNGVDVESGIGRPAADWDAEAVRLEAEGNWRDALRCRYRALIAGLSGAGLVDEVAGRTTGEYRSLVSVSRPSVDAPFADATDLFDRAWYGNEPIGRDEATAFSGYAERVLAGTR